MIILDSLSLTRTTKSITQQQTTLKPATSLSYSPFENEQNGVKNLIPLKVTPSTITNDSCEMTTNKSKLVQQQQHPELEQKNNKVFEKFMIQKISSPSLHKIKEMIKNNNENLNDELAMTAIENNMTIANNTMPQEEQQNNDNKNINENSIGAEWNEEPATYCCHHNRNNCNGTNTNTNTTGYQTTNRNAFAATATNTTTTTTSTTFKNFNVENADENNVQEKEIMLKSIQNNVDLNTFALPLAVTTTRTIQNFNTCSARSGCCSCLPLDIYMRDAASTGMFMPLPKSEQSYSPNNFSNCVSATYNDNDDGGASYCHNSDNKNDNNCNNKNNNNSSSSSNNNNNNIILNTNSFVTVECLPLACENEREQESRNLIQNGYENSGNAAATADTAATTIINNNSFIKTEILAEYSTVCREREPEHEYFSAYSNGERIKYPIGYLVGDSISSTSSPVDSVLENFEKFLNSVKLENRNLNPFVAECHDLIDLSDDANSLPVCHQANVIDDECNKLERNETISNPLLNNNSEIVNLVQNSDKEQTKSDDRMQVKNVENQCNLENLLYCDLNETLEEQNLLESKEILQLTTDELTPTQPVVETAKIIKTITEVNQILTIGDYDFHDDNDSDSSKNKLHTNTLKVDELNETTAKTPVTCINFNSNYSNENVDNTNDNKEQYDTCVVVQRKKSCQNSNNCSVATTSEAESRVPLENVIISQIRSSSIENISPPIQNKSVKSHNLNHSANGNNCANGAAATNTLSISCSTTNIQPQTQQIQTDFAEYKNNCHHSQQQQQQQQQKELLQQKEIRIQDQFTSAYTLRDFAKCLKPSADEDIIYTLNFTQNENEKEKLQKLNFNFNFNSNKQTNTTNEESVSSSEIKSIENIVSSEKNLQNFNENNLYNNNFESAKVLTPDDNVTEHITNYKEIYGKSESNCEKPLINQDIVKLKDTQFLEIENFPTPTFSNSKKPEPKIQSEEINICEEVANEIFELENIQVFDNELKFDCNEKIYTRENKSQPLLYLTFVGPTKNEGQVVTTILQGNDDQRENETVKQAKTDKEDLEKEYRFNKKYGKNNNSDNNHINADDKFDCSCEFSNRILEKTYGTCNKKRVEGSHKGQQLKAHESKQQPEQNEQETFNNKYVYVYDSDGDLFEQGISIDKQKSEYKNQCLYNEIVSRQHKELKNEIKLQKNPKKLTSVFTTENKAKKNNNIQIEKNFPCNIEEVKEKSQEIKKSENKNVIIASEKCVLQNQSISNGQDGLKNENNTQTLNIKNNNNSFNKTESVYNQDNGENILNLNKGIKRLCEINSHLLHATHHHHNQLLEKEQDEQLNLEEFEASQRLKRLLQQHQQFRTRYDTLPATQLDNYKQTNTTTTTIETKESLKTEITRHSKDDLCIAKNKQQQEGVLKPTTTNTNTTTTTTATRANKLQADCEITLERSSLLHVNNEHKQNVIEINKNLKEQQQKDHSNINEQKECANEVQKGNEKQEFANRVNENEIKVLQSKETDESVTENKRNSPQALYISKKTVRLTQQQQQAPHTHSNSLQELDSPDKQQQQQRQNQQTILIESSSNLRFPIENINKLRILQKPSPSPSPSKFCNLNFQHIVKTKQLLQQQQQELELEQEIEQQTLKKSETKSCSPPPLDTSQLNEYKSAFVPTKPEIYKCIKPLTGTTTATIPLTPATATLSEFDTQRFSDFFYLNYLTTSLNNNNKGFNYYVNNNNNCSTNIQIAHVLPTQQQQEQLQQYPLYITNVVDPIQLPYCYDELYLNDTQQHETLNAATKTPTITTDIANNNHIVEADDDLISISSNNSSPCDCVNCQQELEQEIDRVRDRLLSIETNVIPVVTLKNTEKEALKLQQQQQKQQQQISFKMREVNGQLRGLLKKPNRPPPTRKNRVVFDETRNEFFEADYIILIREDCAYDEEDEEPCTCGEHELVRLCCEEGCQCNYSTAPATTDDNRTPQSPKFAPPIEFVDEAALSPPDGYKDNGLKNTLGGALSGHIFGAQHLQQLQVIQRLQQQRAAMLAARNNQQIPPPPPPATATPSSAASVNQQSSTASTCSSSSPLNSSSTPSTAAATLATTVISNNNINPAATRQQHSLDDDSQGVCTECAECAECAAKQLQQDAECTSPQCQEDLTAQLGVPAVALLPIHTSSPERRITQKEIIAGEERPRYVLQAQYKSSPVKNRKDSSKNKNKFITVQKTNNQRYVVETITMTTTTVSERRIIREATEDLAASATSIPAITATTAASASSTCVLSAGGDSDLLPPALPAKPSATSINNDLSDSEKPPPIPPKENSPTTQISGILKGGKLWKQDSISQQSDDQNNTTSEDEAGSTSNGTIKRSVRFVTEEISNDEVDGQLSNVDEDNQINELIPIKKHSTLFKNALRPNSAVQQLFPSTVSHQTLTSEALRAFDESKRSGCLVSTLPGSAGDSDTLRRSMERNILRRSLIK